MSETDTPKNQPNLPENSTADLTGESVNPQARSQENPQPDELLPKTSLEEVAHRGADLPQTGQTRINATPSSTELATLATQISQLRQHNTDLLDRVTQLEAELEEARQELKVRQERSTSTEVLLSQRFEELEIVQGQNERLLRELELAHQTAQRQQILVETLTEQLETDREQVAQLERDCTLTQQRYNEQATRLSKTEKNCRDLRTRLFRQQRYTLQFKNALEKCMQLAETGNRASIDQPDPQVALEIQGFVPKAPAIQPWSATSQFDGERFDVEPEIDSALPQSSPTPAAELETDADIETTPAPPAEISLLAKKEDQLSDAAEEVPLQPLQPSVDSPETVAPPTLELERDRSPLVAEGVETLLTGEVPTFENRERYNPSQTSESDALMSPSNWPSPLVYPLRPQKKIASLAAIDLPTFPRPSS